jgi:hypothetical protein
MRTKIITITAISLLLVSCYSIKKYKAALSIMEKLVVLPKDIKDVRVSLEKISFRFSLQLINHTEYDLGVTTGSVLSITKVKVFTPEGTVLANIDTDISSFELPANGIYIIENLQVELATVGLLTQLDTLLEYISQNTLHYELTINAFGKEFKVMI